MSLKYIFPDAATPVRTSPAVNLLVPRSRTWIRLECEAVRGRVHEHIEHRHLQRCHLADGGALQRVQGNGM